MFICTICKKRFNSQMALTGHYSWHGKLKLKPPMLGKKHTEDTKKKFSKMRKGSGNAFFGKYHSETTKRKISCTKKKWWKGLSLWMKNRISRKGTVLSKEHKGKIAIASKRLWKDPDYRNKVIQNVLKSVALKPNQKEKELQILLNYLHSGEWQFVGDGKFIINGYCPDFINVNGKKQIIELFGDYWHKRKDRIEVDRRKLKTYQEFGYKTLVVWEHELKNKELLEKKINKFVEVTNEFRQNP